MTLKDARPASSRDYAIVDNLINTARGRNPIGSYSMVACWSKGKRRVVGKNRVSDPGRRHSPLFNEIQGKHAEVDVLRLASIQQVSLCGGTLYVTGCTLNTSRPVMQNTAPCWCCRALLLETRIRFLVYLVNGELVKEQL